MADTQIQRFNPVLRYGDGEKAMVFLEEAFGFEPGPVHRSPDGVIVHAEMKLGGQYIGLSERAKSEKTIFDLGPCVVYVVLDDGPAIDAMHARAVSAGAEIVMEPQDQDYGSRDFSARDPEGFVWAFGTYRPGT
jgi:uncharacterized glyoxalase superfamily protein PhnB